MMNLKKGIGGAILTFAFICGVIAATSTTAQAQYQDNRDYRTERRERNRQERERNREWRRRQRERSRDGSYENDPYRNNGGYGGYNNQNQIELNQGYQQGLNTGASDGQKGQSYSPQRSRYYQNASTQAFRDGFVRGYDEGYRQYSNNGGNQRGNMGGGLGRILGEILGRP
jgi:hypothetical protein